jgi:hypothetical protein
MRQSQKTLLAQSALDTRARALGLARPAVEAALCAAVALGLIQAGLNVMAPQRADASSGPDAHNASQSAGAAIDAASLASPFAPGAAGAPASATAQALAASVRVAGVRVAANTLRSGATLYMADGAQRAFLVGEDLGDGVRLAAVTADGVTLAWGEQERIVALPAPVSFSYARALMGQASSPETQFAAVAAPSAPLATPALAGEAESPFAANLAPPAKLVGASPLSAALAPAVVSPDSIAPAAATPAAVAETAAAFGLNPGDAVISVNGAPVTESLAALLLSAPATPVTVDVRRADGALATLSVKPRDVVAAFAAAKARLTKTGAPS